ncbi:glutaredoxin [Synechococcus phage SynMITS9220M01]|nr:glutaredoxin [Synechococcus phage SynMITS9220M01]
MKDLVTIYSNGNQECDRVISLIENMGKNYQVYRLNGHFTQRAFEQEFGEGAEYPQIAIGYRHIGNLKETLQHLQSEGEFCKV